MELATAEIQSHLGKDTTDNGTLGNALLVATKCKCLQSCTSIEYDAETSQGDYNWQPLFKALKIDISKEDTE